ncbi:helix-turn-helix domain-containing protein [Candidatus Gottesmanbacteria bacterium]|nr:helix-turn-helix domain-containing protein [Candidatus Gottesmanbacteria bacterium]
MNKIIKDFLLNLGLTAEESAIYASLLDKGPQTVLEVSRNTNVDRTGAYRLLEKLHAMGIVEEIIEENRKMYKAVGLHTLEFLVREKETAVKKLRESMPIIENYMSSREGAHQPGTKVLFYRGRDGIKQQVWNTLRAEKEAVGYSYRRLSELIGDYYIKWFDEWVARRLIFRDIISDEYLRSISQRTVNPHLPEGHFFTRYISEDILNINHQMDIYNNVVSIYNWYEGEVFGVEIYNEKVASFQRQIFEILWARGEER